MRALFWTCASQEIEAFCRASSVPCSHSIISLNTRRWWPWRPQQKQMPDAVGLQVCRGSITSHDDPVEHGGNGANQIEGKQIGCGTVGPDATGFSSCFPCTAMRLLASKGNSWVHTVHTGKNKKPPLMAELLSKKTGKSKPADCSRVPITSASSGSLSICSLVRILTASKRCQESHSFAILASNFQRCSGDKPRRFT